MIQVVYAPMSGTGQLGQVLALFEAAKLQALPNVNFNIMQAGETVCLTADGFKVTLRLQVKAFRRRGTEKGVALYDMDFDVVPIIAPLLTVEQHENERAN